MNYEKLVEGLKAHHFVRMTAEDSCEQRRGNEDNLECACGLEFEDSERLREHQELHLRIYLGVHEKTCPVCGAALGHRWNCSLNQGPSL